MRLIDADLMKESITRATGLAKIIIGKEKRSRVCRKDDIKSYISTAGSETKRRKTQRQ